MTLGGSSPQDHYTWRLYDAAGTRRFGNVLQQIRAAVVNEPAGSEAWIEVLAVLALVEMTERPLPVRACEWVAFRVLMRRRAFTLGPFQLRNAPWDVVEASRIAMARLIASDCAPNLSEAYPREAIAAVWNGSPKRSPGSVISYADALGCAAKALCDRSLTV